MEQISTIVLLRELSKRMKNYRLGGGDGLLSTIEESLLVELDNAMENTLHSYIEHLEKSVAANLEEFRNGTSDT